MPTDANSHFSENNEVKLHYHLHGQSAALIFVHGHPNNEMT